MNDRPTLKEFEELKDRVAELEKARLSVDAAIDRAGLAIGETISTRLVALFDQKIEALETTIDNNHKAVMAQFEKLAARPREH
jgi:hypothetical protein